MAIVAPFFVTCQSGQALSLPVTVPADTTGWAAAFTLRGYAGGPALVTATTAAGITNAPGASSSTLTVALAAADLALAPGLYEWALERTNAGSEYPVIDRSGFLVTAAAGAAYPRLTNLGTYLAALGLSQAAFASDDPAAAQHLWALAAAESALRRACNRQFTYATRTAYLPAAWSDRLPLPETPVEAVTAVYDDPGAAAGQGADDFAAATLLAAGTDYFLDRDRAGDTYSDSGLLYRVGGLWAGARRRPPDLLTFARDRAPGRVKVTWAGGYGNAVRPPEDLLAGVFECATVLRKYAPDGRPAASLSGEGESVGFGPYQFDQDVMRLASTRQVIDSYRRVAI